MSWSPTDIVYLHVKFKHTEHKNNSFAGKYHGVILLPEGLIENIPEFYALLQVSSLLSVTWFFFLRSYNVVHSLAIIHGEGVQKSDYRGDGFGKLS